MMVSSSSSGKRTAVHQRLSNLARSRSGKTGWPANPETDPRDNLALRDRSVVTCFAWLFARNRPIISFSRGLSGYREDSFLLTPVECDLKQGPGGGGGSSARLVPGPGSSDAALALDAHEQKDLQRMLSLILTSRQSRLPLGCSSGYTRSAVLGPFLAAVRGGSIASRERGTCALMAYARESGDSN